MGAVFALASAVTDITRAHPEAVAAGLRITFAVAGLLIVIALAIGSFVYARRYRGRAETGGDLSPIAKR